MKENMMEVERKVKVSRNQKDLVVKIFGNTPTLRCKDLQKQNGYHKFTLKDQNNNINKNENNDTLKFTIEDQNNNRNKNENNDTLNSLLKIKTITETSSVKKRDIIENVLQLKCNFVQHS